MSVGAGALLAGFVMFLKPRLVRDVGQAASTATADLVASTATEVAARIAVESILVVYGMGSESPQRHGNAREDFPHCLVITCSSRTCLGLHNRIISREQCHV